MLFEIAAQEADFRAECHEDALLFAEAIDQFLHEFLVGHEEQCSTRSGVLPGAVRPLKRSLCARKEINIKGFRFPCCI